MNIFKSDGFPILLGVIILFVILWKILSGNDSHVQPLTVSQPASPPVELSGWRPPDTATLGKSPDDEMVRYGRDLIAHTAEYFWKKGKVATISNGLNCQNCHLDAGAREFGNALTDVSTGYPRFRNRSGRVESIEFRINDCMLRSMNGKPLDSNSHEMRAMVAYLKWLGTGFPKEELDKPEWNTETPPYMDRAADPQKGKAVFQTKCVTCHGENGQGLLNSDSSAYTYPPLWGGNSYNTGAGLFRIGNFASYVWYNMPFGTATRSNKQLTAEEAWDVAAFVNSQPRPTKEFKGDWPDIRKKSIDNPSGPYADQFTEKQHKYGPFKPIIEARKLAAKK